MENASKTVKLYAFRPVPTNGNPTRKTKQIESLLTYQNATRIAESDTGVIYQNWDAAMDGVGKKNIQLAKSQREV